MIPRRSINLSLAAFLTVFTTAGAQASTTFGTLSNFDCFNDTGEETHGFEIELEGISSADVVYTFGEPYQRYGNPEVVEYPGGVYVRYRSAYDPDTQQFTATTPLAPAVINPTDGHACWTGGSGDYLSSGCEHFGVSLNGNPTKTTYRWLVADPQQPGTLKAAGTDVHIPAPIWSLKPPPPESPDQVNPVVNARIAPPEPHEFPFGDALWMKVYKTESPEPADLDHLVTDDDRVPDEPAEVEMEWQLLQSEVGVPHEAEHEDQIAEGNESVTRRYEFYEYTGAYDPEDHEARPEDDSNPAPGELGNYIGSQMAAVNLDAPVTTSTTVVAPLCGDADDDGQVLAADALAALRAAVSLESVCTLARCDTDNDGVLHTSDALRILKAAVGQPVVLVCPA